MAITSVLFSGVGGQGIILASKLLGRCAFAAGLDVKESELHGMAQRGGSVISHVRFGDVVHSPLIPQGCADFYVALEELEGLRYRTFLKPSAQIILNCRQIVPATVDPEKNPYPSDVKAKLQESGFLVTAIDAAEIARQVGNMKVENVILTGALSRYLDFPVETWETVIRELVPHTFVEVNVRAFHAGREAAD
jgi:indolepyruvate ferredoxin oxidoreductase beta subunit